MITKRINHYGIVVKDIDRHIDQFLSHLFDKCIIGNKINDPLQNVNVLFIHTEGGCIELIEPIDETSPVYEFVKKRPAGYHHICIEVTDIEKAIEECEKNGQTLISPPKPAAAFGNRKIAFVVGRDRLLWELLEEV
jgi:methylmalonyl-CoA/ethylmalonyl-CoA epimerase